MRILELITTMDTGGAEKMLATLAFALRRCGHDVHIVCLGAAGEMAVSASAFKAAGIPIVELRKGEGMNLRVLRALSGYAKRHQIQVIHGHSHQVSHYAAAAARMSGSRAVVNTVHGIDALQMAAWAKILYRVSSAATSRMVAVSNAVKDALCREMGMLSTKIAVIENGVDLGEFLKVRPRAADGQFVFGTIGRLVPVKNQAAMIQALGLVRRAHPDCRLEILGSGELEAELRRLVQALDLEEGVVFHGFRTDIPRYLSGIDCFVLSSFSEGLPMTLLEAMASGIPVLTSPVGGMPAVIRESGCGWLTKGCNAEQIAEGMETALGAEDTSGRGQRGRDAARRRYSAETMCTKYVHLFEHLLGIANAESELAEPRLQVR